MRSRRAVVVLTIVTLMASVLLVAPAAGSGELMVKCDHEYVKVHGRTIKVLPTGVDDTANLQCALDLAASMPWAKVKLIAGDYYTSFLEVAGFHGVFKGAGRKHTTIMTLPAGLDCVARFEETERPVHLMTFGRSNITMKGFTVGIGGDAPCAEPWYIIVTDEDFIVEEWAVGAIWATSGLPPEEDCSTDPVQHRFRAFGIGVESVFPPEPGPDHPVAQLKDLSSGIIVSRYEECPMSLHGDVVVRGSHFTGTGGAAVGVFNTQDSTAVIGGPKPWQGNTMTDVGFGVWVGQSNNSRFYAKGNRIHDVHYWGMVTTADEFDVVDPFSVMFAKNDIVGIDYADGVGVIDAGVDTIGHPLIDATVAHNTIDVTSDFNGVYVIGTDGKVVGNRISGDSFSGVFVDGLGYYDETADELVTIFSSNGWYVARNKFRGLEPYMADVFLSFATDHNTVICKCRHDTVVDEGIDNLIVGCKLLPMEEPVSDVQSVFATPTMPDKPMWRFER